MDSEFQSLSLNDKLVPFKPKRLPLFGLDVEPSKIDFSWTLEKVMEGFQPDDTIKLTAVKLSHGGRDDALDGIQLFFSNGISSPIFSSMDFSDETLKSYEVDQSQKVNLIQMRGASGLLNGVRLSNNNHVLLQSEE